MKGITTYFANEDNGKLRLVMDDVVTTSSENNKLWKHIVLFTSNTYDTKAIKELSLSKDQYAEIGENLIFRLLALNNDLK